jgi:hypothetical protein
MNTRNPFPHRFSLPLLAVLTLGAVACGAAPEPGTAIDGPELETQATRGSVLPVGETPRSAWDDGGPGPESAQDDAGARAPAPTEDVPDDSRHRLTDDHAPDAP